MNRPSPQHRARQARRTRSLRGFLPSFQALEDRRLLATTIINDGDPGFSATPAGAWTTWYSSAYYQGDDHEALAGDGSARADYTFAGLPAGQPYDVQVTWPAYANRAPDAPYTITDGSATLGSRTVNQQVAPEIPPDATGVAWHSLGTFASATGTLDVRLSSVADGNVEADAVRIVPRSVQAGGPGFSTAGSWAQWPGYGHGGSLDEEAMPGDGSSQADYSFDGLTAGRHYLVEATWPAYPNRATNAPYAVTDGSATLGTTTINQQLAPSGPTDPSGTAWQVLGTFSTSSGRLVVEQTNLANGNVEADAVRIRPVAASPVTVVAVAATRPEATEGDPTPGDFTIIRTGDRTQPLTVYYTVAGTAVEGTDYQPLPRQAIIPAGSATVDVPVVPIGPPSNRGDVTASLSIQASPSGYVAGSAGGPSLGSSATVTIHDGIPVVSITAPQTSASEVDGTPGAFVVSRTGGLSSPLIVNYSVDGSAIAGVDYAALPGSVTIPAGSTSASIELDPIGNAKPGGNIRTATITLLSGADSTLGQNATATVSIQTDAVSMISVPEGLQVYEYGTVPFFGASFTSSNQYYDGSRGLRSPVSIVHPDPLPYGSVAVEETSTRQDGLGRTLTGDFFFSVYTPPADMKQGEITIPVAYTNPVGGFQEYTKDYFYWNDQTPPSLDAPGDQSNHEGDSPTLAFNATDPDDNPLTYSATNLPPGLSIDPVYGTITGSIDYGDSFGGPYRVTVTATNGLLNASQSFLWNVAPAAPSIDNADDSSWDTLNNAEGDSVLIPVLSSDPDNLPLTYSATGLPAGLSIDPNSGFISGVVAPGDDTGAAYDVVVSVSNGYKATTLEFPWTIDKVALTAPADQTNTAEDSVSLALGAVDLNGLTLGYTADGLPDGLSIDPNSGIISGTVAPSGADGIPWQVTVDATDGVETSERTFQWTVLPSVIPSLSLANPGPQVNATTDVISLPIQGQASGPDDLTYSVAGLPNGLDIDPSTGIISGMDDDFNAADGTVYAVTITVTDDYEQTATQSFGWRFNAPSAISPSSASGGPTPFGSGTGVAAQGLGQTSGQGPSAAAQGQGVPSTHPKTESRDPNYFNVDAFWQNVEKLPGGIDAENWLLSQNGQVQWGWLLAFTRGRYVTAADGTSIPVVYIAWTNNEAQAAEAFVNNVRSTWTTGFAAEFGVWKIQQGPIDPVSWQGYIKERTQAMGSVVVAGAELYLSGLSIVNEGADFVVTLNDIATSETAGGAALAAVGLLPFISNGAIKIVRQGRTIITIGPAQRQVLDNYFSACKQRGVTVDITGNAGVYGGVRAGQKSFSDLQNVRNLSGARLQVREDTCGLFAAASIIDEVNPTGTSIDISRVTSQIQGNKKNNLGLGLDSYQLTTFLDRNLKDTAVNIMRGVRESDLLQYLTQGTVVAHVDGNHWVRVLGTVQDGNSTWVQIYDPARGNYEQLLSSFITRSGANNEMIWVRH